MSQADDLMKAAQDNPDSLLNLYHQNVPSTKKSPWQAPQFAAPQPSPEVQALPAPPEFGDAYDNAASVLSGKGPVFKRP